MTTSQILYFMTVAEEGNITRTANRLFVSQPSISKSIAALEKELGFSLFTRHGSNITLTYAGTRLFDFFSRNQKEYQEIIKDIEQQINDSSTMLRIGCPTTWNYEMFYGKIESYLNKHFPQVELSLSGVSHNDLVAMVRNHQIDFALTIAPYDTTHLGLISQELTTCGCGLLYSRHHFPDVNSIEDFRDTNFLMYDSKAQAWFEEMIQNICPASFVPKTKSCGNPENSLFETSRGNGIMFLSEWAQAVQSNLFGFMPLDKKISVFALYLADNKNSYIGQIAEHLASAFQK